jgi:hypothetical protein
MGRNFPPSENQDWVYVGGNHTKNYHGKYNNQRNHGGDRADRGDRKYNKEHHDREEGKR